MDRMQAGVDYGVGFNLISMQDPGNSLILGDCC